MKKLLTLLTFFAIYSFVLSQTTLSFDGSDDYVAINKSYSSPISAFTAEVWFKTNFNTGGDFDNWAFICFDRSEYWNFSIVGDGRVGFHSTNVSGATDDFYSTANSGLVDGTWHHAAAVYDGTDKIIYLDGVEIARNVNAHLGESIGRSGETRFGYLGDGSEASSYNSLRNGVYYDGMLTEVRVWSVARSASEILANFNTCLSGTEANLDIYYNFSETSGTTLTDLTGNGSDGTIDGTTWVNDNPSFKQNTSGISAGADQTVCAGTNVTLTGSGASSYAWDNGVTNATAFSANATTTYTVIATNSCGFLSTDQVVITVNALPSVDAGADQTVCAGTNVTLTGSGASSYAWDNGVTNATAFAANATTTSYTVTGTDANSCTATDQIVVTVNALPTVTTVTTNATCNGDANGTATVTAAGGTGTLTY